jgi:phytoene synthase
VNPCSPLLLATPEQTQASNLAFALKFLPKHRRGDAMIFYRFCRAVDDLADDATIHESNKRRGLESWRMALERGEGLPSDLHRLMTDHQIPGTLLSAIVQGCEMDIVPQPFVTLEQLRNYCWHVACAVGLVSIRLFGCKSNQSEAYATHLGYALQFTNIIRDVGEDAALGRVYLPHELMAPYGVTARSLIERSPTGDLHGALKVMANHAESEFEAADSHLVPADRSALLPAEIMGKFYRRLLSKMTREGFPVLNKRCRLTRFEKLALALSVILRTRWTLCSTPSSYRFFAN